MKRHIHATVVTRYAHNLQSVGVRACESAIAHVRAVIQVRKGCEASWNCACEVRACGGIYEVRSHLKFYQ